MAESPKSMDHSDQDTSSSSIVMELSIKALSDTEEVKTCPSYHLPKAISLDLIESRPIAIIVGSEPYAKQFFCHKKLLESQSQYFRSIHDTNTSEHTYPTSHNLPEDDPAAFAVIVQWLYNKILILPPATASANRIALIGSWCLAEKLGIQNCQNAIMDKIHASLVKSSGDKCVVGIKAMMLINDLDLPEDNMLRIFFIQRFAYEMVEMKRKHCRWNGGLKSGYVQFFKLCPSLVHDIMIEWYSSTIRDDSTDPADHTDMCAYHIHGDPAEKPAMPLSEQLVGNSIETAREEDKAEEKEIAKGGETVGEEKARAKETVGEKEIAIEEETQVKATEVSICGMPIVFGKFEPKPLAESDGFWDWDRLLRKPSSAYVKSVSLTSQSHHPPSESKALLDGGDTITDDNVDNNPLSKEEKCTD